MACSQFVLKMILQAMNRKMISSMIPHPQPVQERPRPNPKLSCNQSNSQPNKASFNKPERHPGRSFIMLLNPCDESSEKRTITVDSDRLFLSNGYTEKLSRRREAGKPKFLLPARDEPSLPSSGDLMVGESLYLEAGGRKYRSWRQECPWPGKNSHRC